MNRKFVIPSGLLRGLILLWTLLAVQFAAANPLCDLAEKWTLLNERLEQEGLVLGQKLGAKLDGDLTIAAHARFQNHPGGLTPKMAAQEKIDEALAAAENVAPGLLGDKAAGAWVDTATLERVVKTDTISYEIQGQGLGKLAERYSSANFDADELTKTVLESRRINFDTTSRPWNGKYNEAHYLRDLDTIFSDPQVTNPNLLKFLNEQKDQAAGRPLEVRVAAARKGEGMEALAADDLYHGADVVTGSAAYNVGLTAFTIKGKLDASEQREAIRDAIFAAADTPGGAKSYEFVVSDLAIDPNDLPSLKSNFDDLNTLIQAQRPGFRLYKYEDIILEEFK